MKGGRAAALAAALTFALTAGAAAEDGSPVQNSQRQTVVRETVDPAQPVLGQHVRLLVDVLFPDSMPAPPEVVTPQAPGLQVFRFESQGLTMRDTIDSHPYAGQRFEFAVYPRRAGTLTVPPVEVRLMNRAGDETGRARGEAQSLTVTAPIGVDSSKPVVASTYVTLKETWQPDNASKPLRVGDALVRTITRQAADTPALGFSALNAMAPQGVRVYVDQPQTNDRVSRGDLTGERTDRLTYVFEKAGDYEVPALSQAWWDLAAKALKKATAPGKRVTVAAAPAPAAARNDSASRLFALGWRRLTALAVGAAIAAALVGMTITRLVKTSRQRRARGPTERALFRALERAGRTADPGAIWRALQAWREAANPDPQALARLPSMQALDRRLFGPDGAPWEAAQGAKLVHEIKLMRPSKLGSATAPGISLPPLNPPSALPRP